jgi:hypothetical protein
MKNFGGESMSKTLGKLFRTSLVVGLIAIQFIAPRALAAAPDDLRALISDSRPSTASTYTITLDQATGTTPTDGETVTITFPAGFTIPAFAASDATWTDNAVSKTVQTGVCGATDTVRMTIAGQVITFEACDSYSGTSGSELVITLGVSSTKITNHATPAVYTITVAGTYGDDSKDTLISIIDGVTLSATVDETLTFTVAARTTGECNTLVTGGNENNNSTSTTLPFGTLNSDTFYNECQRLTVGTNAAVGYSTTVHTTARPTSGSNTIPKATCDGAACSDTVSAPWDTATNYGYGYCVKDSTGDAAATADATEWTTAQQCGGGSQAFKSIARADNSDTPRSIMASAAATTANDITDIGVRISIGASQAAGTYTTTVIYITTPTF